MGYHLDWPQTKKGGRKPLTTPTNQAIWKAVVRAGPPEQVQPLLDLLDSSANNWRNDYKPIVEAIVRVQATADAHTALGMCRAGLETARNLFVYRKDDWEKEEEDASNSAILSVSEFFKVPFEALPTSTVTGNKDSVSEHFEIATTQSSDSHTVWLNGEAAISILKDYEQNGSMEQSALIHASETCRAVPNFSNTVFCLLGLTSELGPAPSLLKLPHMHVIGVARSGKKLDALCELAKATAHTSTKLEFPSSGADMLTQLPQIIEWIIRTAGNKELALLPLAYMDGEANVRLSVAMDIIVTSIMNQKENVKLAYLSSPATVYTIPKEAALDAHQRYKEMSWTSKFVSKASGSSWLKPSISIVDEPILFNGIYRLQGPNYCLAKTLQQWRCMVEHSKGKIVCAPHTPPSKTLSMTHNAQAAAALAGMAFFPPLRVFSADECASLMTAIMLHQLATKKETSHPMELFWDGAVHGGMWRCPYEAESISAPVYMLGAVTSIFASR